jgi:hypothetical protein
VVVKFFLKTALLLKLYGCGVCFTHGFPLPNLFYSSSLMLNLLYAGQRGGGSRPS